MEIKSYPKISFTLTRSELLTFVKIIDRMENNYLTGINGAMISDLCNEVFIKLKKKAVAPNENNKFTLLFGASVAFYLIVSANTEQITDPYAKNLLQSIKNTLHQQMINTKKHHPA